MKLQVEIDEQELKELVRNHLQSKLGDVDLKSEDIKIEVKSTQNYKSEWESARFRARVDKYQA